MKHIVLLFIVVGLMSSTDASDLGTLSAASYQPNAVVSSHGDGGGIGLAAVVVAVVGAGFLMHKLWGVPEST